MREYSLSHLSDAVLLRDLAALISQERVTIASLLAHIAEVDARRIHVPIGYPSMHAYCVGALGMSEDAALRRIQAARAARRFPLLFTAVAEGQLHLTAVCLLAPHLTSQNVDELVKEATGRRKSDIEELLSHRFSTPHISSSVRAVPPGCVTQHALAHVERATSTQLPPAENPGAPIPLESPQVETSPPCPQKYLVKLAIDKNTHEKLRYAQALLSHAVPTGDIARVFDRALDALIAQLEKAKLGTGTGPVRGRRSSARTRYVPAHVRRAVWERDHGQCTFVGSTGHRCDSRRFLEFDHVDPYARGGQATIEGMRLRCRAHNQLEAERAFGAEFIERKREEARLAAQEARDRAAEAAVKEQTEDVIACLRTLGIRGPVARQAAESTRTLENPTIEERVRAALGFVYPSRRPVVRAAPVP
jgi:5-methylcytosine-specific restriction endonuclease McrA